MNDIKKYCNARCYLLWLYLQDIFVESFKSTNTCESGEGKGSMAHTAAYNKTGGSNVQAREGTFHAAV
jgi:hypothetical protein